MSEGYTFLAAFGIQDDLRDGVKGAVESLKKANITVRMISGDNIETAKMAAYKASIINQKDLLDGKVCMTGEDLMRILKFPPQKEQKIGKDGKFTEYFYYGPEMKSVIMNQVADIKVLARCTPEQKLNFIVALQTIGSSVAVTAEGINDVPSFKQAEVGFCMGQSGCEIAKDASDIIFLDDNFESVYKATLWGRNIQDNIRKFIQFQMVINIVCVIMVFLGGATLGNSPFSVIQMLWINLIMDILAAISLATEPPAT